MNKTLSTFMSIAAVVLILSSLLIGVVYTSLSDKDVEHRENLKDEYNLQVK
ncbi:hypothetical protein [Pontibacillus halophilus]|uniref:hypothetical protein n=1 Tax=Pontibacillus halophilus TaxID=516704 RepID=UPI00040B6EB3|nr:hypothetical protein [Pontibacillus halophilus]